MAVDVLLIAGPAGAGKTSTAARVVARFGFAHVAEDDYWVQVKAGQPGGTLRTTAEQDVVLERVVADVCGLAAAGRRVVVDFVLYEDPPRPLLVYRERFAAAGLAVACRLLRPDVAEIVARIDRRGRPGDVRPGVRADAEHQWQVLGSDRIDPAEVVDSTRLTVDEVINCHIVGLLAAG